MSPGFALLLVALPAVEVPELVVPIGHGDVVEELEYSPDGALLASGSRDRSVRLWQVSSGELLRILQGLPDWVRTLRFSPDGRHLAAASRNHVAVWDPTTGALRALLQDGGAAEFGPDSRTLATGDAHGVVRIWRMDGLEPRAKPRPERTLEACRRKDRDATRLAFSPDGSRLAIATWDRLCVVEVASGRLLLERDRDALGLRVGHGNHLAFIGSTSLLVAGGRITELDLATGQATSTRDLPAEAFSLDRGQSFYVAGWSQTGKDLVVAERVSGRILARKSGESAQVFSAALSPRGDRIATSGSDRIVREWSPSLEPLQVYSADATTLGATAGSGDGRWIAWNRDHDVVVLDLFGNRPGRSVGSGDAWFAAIDRDGRWLAASFGAEVTLYDLPALERRGSLRADPGRAVRILRFDPSGGVLLARTTEAVHVWDAQALREIRRIPLKDDYPHLAAGNGGAFAISGSPNAVGRRPSLEVWDQSGQRVAEIVLPKKGSAEPNDLAALAGSRDGSTYAATTRWGTQLILLDANTGRVRGRSAGVSLPTSGHALALSPDGSSAVIAGGDVVLSDPVVHVLPLPGMNKDHPLRGHTGHLRSARYLDNGVLLTSAADGTLRVWRPGASTAAVAVAFFSGAGSVDWAAVAPDGRFDGTPGGLARLHYVHGTDLLPLEAFSERFHTPGLLAAALRNQEVAAIGAAPDLRRSFSPPPRVRFVSPLQATEQDGESLEVIVEASDKGGGVDEIRLFQNSKLVAETERGVRKTKAEQRSFRIALAPGPNVLRAVAFGSDRTESPPEEVTVTRRSPTPRARLFILAVGISAYVNPKYALDFGRPDATAFASVLGDRAASIFASVDPTLVLDRDATRSGIEAAFASVKAKAGPADAFVFFYAGHGVMSEGNATAPPEFYLAPAGIRQLYGDDAGLERDGISASRLRDMVTGIAAQKQLLVLDACQSGGAVRTFGLRGAAEERALAQLARSAGIVVLAAAQAEQYAAEVRDLGHGLFTHALLAGLRGDADRGGDGKITVKELEAYLGDEVPALTERHRGTPQYPNSFSQGQDFPIGVRP